MRKRSASLSQIGSDPTRPIEVFHALKEEIPGVPGVPVIIMPIVPVKDQPVKRPRRSSFPRTRRDKWVPNDEDDEQDINPEPFRNRMKNTVFVVGHLSCKSFQETGDVTKLLGGEAWLREAARLDPEKDLRIVISWIAKLADDAYENSEDPDLLQTRIRLRRELLEIAGPVEKAQRLFDLARAIHDQFRIGNKDALDDSIKILREVLMMIPVGDEMRIQPFLHLAAALTNRHKLFGREEDIIEAIDLLHGAIELCPEEHPSRGTLFVHLGTSLRTRAEREWSKEVLNDSVSAYQEALKLHPPGHPQLGRLMCYLAIAKHLSLKKADQPNHSDILEITQLHEGALKLLPETDTTRAVALHSLGAITLDQAIRSRGNDEPTFRRALEYLRQAVDMRASDDPERLVILKTLGEAMFYIGERMGDTTMLGEAQHLLGNSAGDVERNFPELAVNNVRTATLHRQAEQTGDRSALEDAIRLLREDHLRKPDQPVLMNNLATALHQMYTSFGDEKALLECVQIHENLADIVTLGDPGRHFILSNYAHVLETLIIAGGPIELRENTVIPLLHQALDLLPAGHPDRTRTLSNLACVIFQHYLDIPTLDHDHCLDVAEDFHREALRLRAATHPDRGIDLNDLASIAAIRFKKTNKVEYLHDSIRIHHEAIQIRPLGHPDRFKNSHHLAEIYAIRSYPVFDLTKSLDYLQTALSDESADPRERLSFAHRTLGRVEDAYCENEDVGNAIRRRLLDCYEEVIHILPQVASFNFDIGRRLEVIARSRLEALGSTAAVHALKLANVDLALELLEQTRSLFWSQALHLRSSEFDNVPESMATELRQLFGELEDASYAAPVIATENIDIMEQEIIYAQRRRQSERAVNLIHEIRQQSGCERFLLGQPSSTLREAAKHGPCVLLLATRLQVFAIIIDAVHPTTAIPLPTVSGERLEEWARTAREISAILDRGSGRPEEDEENEFVTRLVLKAKFPKRSDVEVMLSEVWHRVVKPIFHALALRPLQGRARPRMYWCPTGSFSFIPLHAAGDYDRVGQSCADYVVSSYTPTLEALLTSRRNMPAIKRNETNGLLVAEPLSPGMPRLSGLGMEAEIFRKSFPLNSVRIIGDPQRQRLEEEGAIILDVLEELPKASLLHLACHGQQNLKEPLESGFYLSDGSLTVRQLMRLKMPRAFFAFLSACETAKGDQFQADQNLHLAATMLFVGFRSVLGTMWTMGDADGPLVSQHIYSALASQEQLEVDDIAYALDEAVQELRRRGVPPVRWATFVHIGA